MIIHWEGRDWTWNDEDIDVQTMGTITAYTGLNLLPWNTEVYQGNPQACQAFLWALKKQNGEATEIATLNFSLVKFIKALTDARMAELNKMPAKTPDPTASPKGTTKSSTKTSESSAPTTSES